MAASWGVALALIWGDDSEEGIRPEAFVRKHLLPFFEEDRD